MWVGRDTCGSLGRQAATVPGALEDEVSSCGSRLKVGQMGTLWGHEARAGGRSRCPPRSRGVGGDQGCNLAPGASDAF